MQNVAWPITIVDEAEADPDRLEHVVDRRVEREAGDDAGQRDREHDEERDRLAAEEAVAGDREREAACRARARSRSRASPALTERRNASRTSGSWNATENHFVVQFWIGHACVMSSLNA